MRPPTTRYTKSGDVSIAYQVIGDGPIDLLYASGWVSNIDAMWDEPSYARFLERLASFSRLIVFDKRGTGLSDRVSIDQLPTMEQRMDDVRAVMDAAGSQSAALFGISEGGPLCMLMAATYPQRADAVITIGGYANALRTESDVGSRTAEQRDGMIEAMQQRWGDEIAYETLSDRAPSACRDERFLAWWGRFLRASASPAAAVALTRMNMQIDIRAALPAISAPTLLIRAGGDRSIGADNSRYMAQRIKGARYLELESDHHLPWVLERDADAVIGAIEEFLTGKHTVTHHDRVLATVVFTDIVNSTPRLVEAGDRSWADLLAQLETRTARSIERYRGKLVKNTGDGVLATFDGPARAIRCAQELVDEASALHVDIRAGLHTGEIELRGSDVQGIAVHVGARVSALAGAREVLVSGTVKDLVAGSGIEFRDHGMHELKGVPDRWRIYAVARA